MPSRRTRPPVKLPPPTRAQLACNHHWQVTHSQRYWGRWAPWPRTRYVRCVHCDLRVRTREELEVPWPVWE